MTAVKLTNDEKCLATSIPEGRHSGEAILEMTSQSETRSRATVHHLCQDETRLEATNPPAMRKERQRMAMTG